MLFSPQTSFPCCYCRRKLIESDFLLFSTVFYSVLASGCDLEDCTVTIFPILQHSDFFRIRFDQYGENEQSVFGSDIESLQYSDIHYIDQGIDDSSDTESSERNVPQAVEENNYLSGIRQLAQFLGQHGLSLLRRRPNSTGVHYAMYQPQRMTLAVLQECGLGSNYNDPDCDRKKPIIYVTLASLLGWEDWKAPKDGFRLNNLVNLIATGADIYDVHWVDEDWIKDFEDGVLMSPTVYAKESGLMPVWKYALYQAGYNPDLVILEDKRNRQEFRRLHGAKSSAVEMSEDISGSAIRRRLV